MTGNENPGPGPGQGRPGVRIGDAEREDAVRQLGEHYAAGRLTEEEHAERTEQAYAARTQADLDGLFGDLPGGPSEQEQHGQWGPPWAQGAPPWAAWQSGGPGGPRGGRPPWAGAGPLRWLPVPFLVIALIGTACALVHGFFPFFVFPLLAVGVTLFVLGRRGVLAGGPRNRPAEHR
ncbi:MAG: DUF1707 domain-containing protein [Streptosporangiales bacterium]|nr:DUF1707 domain-containing protein [Streptosporangiales bacterium]